jgi:hypothetical protein
MLQRPSCCLNDACGHQALIDVSSYPGETEVPWFSRKIVRNKCGARGRHVDVTCFWPKSAWVYGGALRL